jgi:hypothetical protein
MVFVERAGPRERATQKDPFREVAMEARVATDILKVHPALTKMHQIATKHTTSTVLRIYAPVPLVLGAC